MEERLLVVDDEEDIRAIVAEVLVDEGYEVERAAHGEEALQIIDRDNLRAILLDMRMPVMNGWDFAQAYRQRPGPHAPIIVMTAAQHPRRWCAEVDADACYRRGRGGDPGGARTDSCRSRRLIS